ncbi:MAG: SufD family Fe-S cluster assembly protein [Spirochaetota bacterium]
MSQYFSDQLQRLQETAALSEWAFRRDALDIFHTYGLPRRKQDPWKYVDNSALLNLPLSGSDGDELAAPASRPLSPEKKVHKTPEAPAKCGTDEEITFCFHNEILDWNNGKPSAARSLDIENDCNLHPAQWHLDKDSLLAEENGYSLINAFSFSQAYELNFSRCFEDYDADSQPVVRLCFHGTQTYQAPRLYIKIPPGREIYLLIDSRELSSAVYWNPYFYFSLGENASLTLLERGPRLLDRLETSGQSPHVRSLTLRGQVRSGARLNSAFFYWGMALAIHDARFAISGTNAAVQMRGICFGEGQSRYHLRCENQHFAADSRSQCLYKNVLFDRSVSEFYGIIHADHRGVGTDAQQNNRNLLLSDQARVIARPQLEILVDDLQCRHGSSTGSIDVEELFYMRSRGLNQNEAMRMAVVGFVEEISTYFRPELLAALGIEDCLHALLHKRNR